MAASSLDKSQLKPRVDGSNRLKSGTATGILNW